MSLPAGRMADRWGVLGTMVLGQAVIALGLLVVAGAPSFAFLVAVMVCAGLGYGIMNPSTAKAVIGWFPPRQRGTVIGLKQVGLPLGGTLGGLLMPPLALAVGWRTAVAVSALAIAALAALTWLLYRDPREAMPEAARPGAPSSLAEVLRSRDLWLVSIATLIFAGVQTAFLAYLVLYLREGVNLPLLTAARYLVIAQVLGTGGRILFGVLSDGLFGGRRRIVLVLAGIGSGACALLMAGTGPATAPWLLAPLAACFGLFGVGWNGVQHTLLAELAGPRAAGTAIGLGLAVSSAGVAIWPPVFGLAVERAGSYGPAWVGLALSMALGLALLLCVRERRSAAD
jgi:predicted MFS family arabinose efflux permease